MCRFLFTLSPFLLFVGLFCLNTETISSSSYCSFKTSSCLMKIKVELFKVDYVDTQDGPKQKESDKTCFICSNPHIHINVEQEMVIL